MGTATKAIKKHSVEEFEGKVVSLSKKSEKKSKDGVGSTVTGIFKNAAHSTKYMTKNAFYVAIYGIMMFATMLVDVYLTQVICGFALGYSNVGYKFLNNSLSSADLLTAVIILVITCGFMLFFGIKIENWLIRQLNLRLWYKDENGEHYQNKNKK